MLRSVLAVTTPATKTALTTVARVKSELSISDTASDSQLSSKIDEATSDIEARCRPFRRETLTETFWPGSHGGHHRGGWHHDWHGGNECLVLSRRPVASIASATVDDVLVGSGEYRIDTEAGLVFRLDASGYASRWYISKAAVVVYDGGYLLPGQTNRNLPAALESAAIELVVSFWAARGRDPLVKSEETTGVARFEYWVGAVGEVGDLPPGVMAKIAPFRKLTVA